jgi:sec-independent protein translocase protein TatB
MIDLGISKLAVIGVVALIVIGPERLPRVARMAGTLYGRAQRYLHQVKSEVSREMELEELRNLHKEVRETAQSVKAEVESFGAQVQSTVSGHLSEVDSVWRGDDTLTPSPSLATPEAISRKAHDFRRKKLVKISSVPVWYKNRHGARQHVLSGAARVRKFRPSTKSNTSFF